MLTQIAQANLNPNWGQQTNATEIQIDGNNILKYANLNYQGLDYPQTDVSAMEYVHLDYKTADASSIEFSLISANPTIDTPYSIPVITGDWQSVDIPLSVYNANLDRVFQFKTVGNGTVYLDNIYFWKAPTAAGKDTSLSALTVNGSTIAGFGPTSATYSVELPVGTSVVPTVGATPTDTNASAVVTAATSIPGTTTVAITSQDGSATRTISIAWTLDSKPQTAAPTPTWESDAVISVYSDAFTENIATNLNPDWGQGTQTTEVQIDGNNALEYENLNYQGLDFSTTDVSAMNYVHLDYYTNDATALDLFLISTGPLENAYLIPVVTGSWQSIDIPLSAYTVPELDKVFSFKTEGNGTIWIDNIYFCKAPAATDTSLSALTVDGSSIADFEATSTNYSIELPAGTTVVPTVAATTTDTNASAVVTAATSIPGTTTVVVTAQDGATTSTVSINWTLASTPPNNTSAPPTPNKAPADVISVYSDAYTSIATNLNPNWGQQTQTTEIQIDGNNTLEYANLNYQGLQYTQTDVSAMEYVHLDYKTADANSIEFFLISAAPTLESAYPIPVVTGEWQSVDIPLSVFSANKDRVFQFKTVGNGTVYLDNIYFWKANSAADTDTSLSALTADGSSIADFGASKTSYSVELPAGTTVVPTVVATTTDTNASAVVTAATSIPGTTTVVVTAQDGATTSTVSINWTLASTPPNNTSAPPTPNKAPADVISVYSDAYTSIATNLDPFWGQATNATEIQIDGNNTLEYANLNYQGLDYSTTDVSAMEYLHLDYKTDDATALDFYLISANPTVENAFSIPIVTGSWQSIDIPLSSYNANLDRVFQFKTVGNGNVYFDNLYFWKAPAAAGTDTSLSDLTVNGSSIAGFETLKTSYSVELPAGTSVVPTVAATPTDTNASAVVTAATSIPGTTTVAITSQDGSATRTISIAWTLDPKPQTAAPVPSQDSADVVSVYSDTYTSIATNLNPGWGQATQTTEIQINGNNTLEYASLNYQGLEYPQTDVSAMEYLHLDYYTDDATALDFFLISADPYLENAYSIPVVTGSWQSIDIPLSEYTVPELDKIFQFKTTGNGTVWFDNIYFWKAPAVAGTELSDLTLDGITIADFRPTRTSYSVEFPYGTTAVPTVAATTTDTNASAVVTDATSIPGTTTIDITAQDGVTTNTVSIAFSIYPSPTTAAPTPSQDSADVISVYSDAYTSNATNLNPDSLQQTKVTEIQIAGNNMLEYANHDYQEMEYPETDVSAMEYLHLDYYTNDATPLVFYLTSANPYLDSAYSIDIVTGSWQSIDIPLSVFTANLDRVFKFKSTHSSFSMWGNGTVWFDNLYFWKAPAAVGKDTSLSALTVDGSSIAGFRPTSTNYSVELPAGTTVVPTVVATTTDTNASAVVTAATSIPGTTSIAITSQDGSTTSTVSIAWTLDPKPQTAAPTPSQASADVISVYSDAFTENIATNLNLGWGQATQTTEVQIDGNNTLEYANLNYQGLGYPQTDVSAMEYVHLDYKTADATAIDFFLISANPTVENPYSIPVVTGDWQSIDIPLSVYTANLDRVFNFKTVGNGTVYFDNIYFWKAPAVAGTQLADLTVDGSSIADFGASKTSYSVELPYGTTTVPTVAATTADTNASAVVTAATSIPGTTKVVVTAQDGSTTSTVSINWAIDHKPQTAAPTPSQDSANVISVYSDAFTENIATNLNPAWGQQTQTTEIQIDGNNTLKYANLNYQGLEYPQTDVSAMEYLHLAYYTTDATALEFFLTSEWNKENPYSIDIVTGSWQSIDIPLSEYTVPELDKVFQFKTVGVGTVYLDNIYFWKALASTPPNDSSADPTSNKAPADVISVYSDAYSSIATNLNPNWGQQTQTTEIQIDGNNILKYENLNYQGLDYPQTDVSAMEYVHLDYKTADATAIDFFLISANPTVENPYSIPVVTGDWQSIDIPLSVYTANLDRVFNFKTVGNGTVYFDNIYFWKAPAAQGTDTSLSDLTVNGSSIAGFGPTSTNYSVELPAGTTVAPAVAATPTDTNASAVVTAATSIPGTTTIVITSQDGSTTSTISIAWTLDPKPQTAAPTPSQDSADVISVYSDAYHKHRYQLNPNWGQQTQTSEVQIDGNNTLEYENLNYQGLDFDKMNDEQTDVSAMEFLHLDYYTTDATVLDFYLISAYSLSETAFGIPIVTGSWQSVDIPLSAYNFTVEELEKVFQFKTVGNGTVWFDNIYFWKAPAVAGTATELI